MACAAGHARTGREDDAVRSKLDGARGGLAGGLADEVEADGACRASRAQLLLGEVERFVRGGRLDERVRGDAPLAWLGGGRGVVVAWHVLCPVGEGVELR